MTPCPHCGGDGDFAEASRGEWECAWCGQPEATDSEQDFEGRFAGIPEERTK